MDGREGRKEEAMCLNSDQLFPELLTPKLPRESSVVSSPLPSCRPSPLTMAKQGGWAHALKNTDAFSPPPVIFLSWSFQMKFRLRVA